MESVIRIFTDGSCNPQDKVGGWAAIILSEKEDIIKGIMTDATHNQMELIAVLKGIDYILNESKSFDRILIYSDSQYVVNIPSRINRLRENNFLTRKGSMIRNQDEVQCLIRFLEDHPIELVKVAAHQKQTDTVNYNRKVDKLVRKLVRNYIEKREN